LTLGRNYYMIHWVTTKRNIQNAHLIKMRQVTHVYRIQLVSTNMQGTRVNRAKGSIRVLHSLREKRKEKIHLSEGKVDENSPLDSPKYKSVATLE
jgi:hypothetical protein